jgi:hypothetical protein
MNAQSSIGQRLAYAIAVRDRSDLFLFAIVRRARRGDVYVHYSHTHFGPDWDGHNSYHVSGQRHGKSYGRKFLVTQRQPLDANFRGTEQVVETSISSSAARAIGVHCRVEKFDDIFEIPITDLRSGPNMRLSVNLTIGEPIPFIMGETIQQKSFPGLPQIVVTLYDLRVPTGL